MTASRRIGEIAIGALPIAAILLAWHALAVSGVTPAALLPPPGTVFARLIQQFGTPQYWEHAATTLFRLFAGFSIAVVVGVTLGVAATGSKLSRRCSSRWCACSRRSPRSRSIPRWC